MPMEVLRTELFGGITLLHVVVLVAGLTLLIALLRILGRLFSSRTPKTHHEVLMKCQACGWTGIVSRYHPTCARCHGKALRPA